MRGCDALLKNTEGRRARKVAAATGHRSTAKACRRAEKTRAASADQLWAVQLYDFCSERRSALLDQLTSLDHDKTGVVSSTAFLQVDFVTRSGRCHSVCLCAASRKRLCLDLHNFFYQK